MKTLSAFAATAVMAVLVSFPAAAKKNVSDEQPDAPDLVINPSDDARKVIDAVPLESAMEKFFYTMPDGHAVAYVGLTDTDVGGLLFVDNKLAGTLSRRDALAFYSCRGYATATHAHWATEADEWIAALAAAAVPVPATGVALKFSGKSTPQSIREAESGPGLSQLSMLDISTNPLSLFRRLNSAREKMRAKEDFDAVLNQLKAIAVGAGEDVLVQAQPPEDVAFGSDGLVMSYPRFAYEFYVRKGHVLLVQQPSFQHVARDRASLFYEPGTQWSRCHPAAWRTALAKERAVQKSAEPAATEPAAVDGAAATDAVSATGAADTSVH